MSVSKTCGDRVFNYLDDDNLIFSFSEDFLNESKLSECRNKQINNNVIETLEEYINDLLQLN